MGIFLANRDAPSCCPATDCLVYHAFLWETCSAVRKVKYSQYEVHVMYGSFRKIVNGSSFC